MYQLYVLLITFGIFILICWIIHLLESKGLIPIYKEWEDREDVE